jgi:tight adherence protein B
MSDNTLFLILISALVFASVYLFVRYAWPQLLILRESYAERYDIVLNKELLLGVHPTVALIIAVAMIFFTGFVFFMFGESLLWFVVGCAAGVFIPNALINHLLEKRKQKLNRQVVDGAVSLASGMRAGLNLVQSMELLVKNSEPPISQEFDHLLREYNLGIDLGQAMNNASNRIGSQHYRLLFSAIQAHRVRGGDVAESMDRITEAIREIQRLEGKLQTLTAQGRNQAWMMAGMAGVVLLIGWMIAPTETEQVLSDPSGRVILLIALGLITAGFLWIRKIMSVDI